jgi:hypothetical protein
MILVEEVLVDDEEVLVVEEQGINKKNLVEFIVPIVYNCAVFYSLYNMSMKKTRLIIIAIVLVLGLWLTSKYNGLVRGDESVKTAWSQVENVYQRRADLIPNLGKYGKMSCCSRTKCINCCC